MNWGICDSSANAEIGELHRESGAVSFVFGLCAELHAKEGPQLHRQGSPAHYCAHSQAIIVSVGEYFICVFLSQPLGLPLGLSLFNQMASRLNACK